MFAASDREFLGLVADSMVEGLVGSRLEAIAIPRPINVEQMRAPLGMTGFLRQYVGT